MYVKICFIIFIGSCVVGLYINEVVVKVQLGQKWIKCVIMEFGGKDGLIVDEIVDIENVIIVVMQGVFGFNGQKCSVMSCLIVVDSVYDEVVNGFVEWVKVFKMGMGEENVNVIVVVNQMSFNKIKGYLELVFSEGKVLLGGEVMGEVNGKQGYYIQLIIVGDVDWNFCLVQEEIFGLVVVVLWVKDW